MRIFRGSLAVFALVVGSLVVAAPAQAAPITFAYTVAASDPRTTNWPDIGRDCSQASSWTSISRSAVHEWAEVSVTGNYVINDLLLNGTDGRILILRGAYDPADVSNCVKEIDDSATVTLQAGVKYTMLLAGIDGTLGAFSYSVDGPGLFTTPAAQVASAVTVSASVASVTVGTAIDLSATVTSPSLGTDLSGTVEFFADGVGIDSAPVDPGTGLASLPSASLAAGTHVITARYSGNAATLGSSSPSLPVTVARSATSTTLTASSNPLEEGSETVLTASVTGWQPTGTVSLLADGALLGSVPLVGGVASLPVSSLAAGQHALTADYSGDANHLPSTTAAPLTLVVTSPAAAEPVARVLALSGSEGASLLAPLGGLAVAVGAILLLARRRVCG